MRKILLILFIVFLLFFTGNNIVKAQGASFYLSPQTGTFFIGDTFNVSIFTNTKENDINAIKVDLKFDQKNLQIASPSTGKSFISVWVSQPSFSNIKGEATFQGGIPSPGINTSSGLVSTITFRAIRPGEATISILDSSQILLDDGKGTNVLNSVGNGLYQIVIPPPEGPKIFSSSHPNQDKWYSNSSPTIFWEKEEGITDFSYSIDTNFYGTPDNISEGSDNSVSFSDLENNIWYFHLKAKKGNVWGGISTYILLIDISPPASFDLSFGPILISPNKIIENSIVSFITTDQLSGVSHYEVKVIDLNNPSQHADFFIEASSPYQLATLNAGEYEIIVKSFDKALNSQDARERIEIVPVSKTLYINKNGINIATIFIPWLVIFLILLFLVLIFIFLIWKRLRIFYQRRKTLKEIKKSEKIEDIEKESKT